MRMRLNMLGMIWQALLGRSGLMASNIDPLAECHELVAKVLNRETALLAISALESALEPPASVEGDATSLEHTVIAFDTNVLLRLSNHTKSADVIDFLRTSFPGKLLLPGQVIQEFWNNQLNAVETVAASIK